MSELSERAARRNTALLCTDYISFGVAMAILGPTTVLPNLVRLLGGSQVAVGILGAVTMGGWMLPQLFAGRLVAGRPFVKWYSVVPLLISRTTLALAVPAVLWLEPGSPRLALAALLGGFTIFTLTDALSGVPWFEMLSKSIPMDRRGRVMGAAQSVSSVVAFAAGLGVTAVMARAGPPLGNHLLLISAAAALFYLNPVAQSRIREPRGGASGGGQLAWRDYFSRVGTILRHDPRFAWSAAMRWLSGLADMGAGFYVLYASDRLGLPPQVVGLFVSAGVLGSLLSGVLLGPLGDRRGPALVIKLVMVLRLLVPVLALTAPWLGLLHAWLPTGALLTIYVAMGTANGAWFVGFMNYILQIAPPEERTTYVGLANTLGGLLFVAPLIAGWLAQAFGYEVLFVAVLAVALLGVLTALRGMDLFAALSGAPVPEPALVAPDNPEAHLDG